MDRWAQYIDDSVTFWAAVAQGGHWNPWNDPTGDINADLITNALGIDFYNYLVELASAGTLTQGNVRQWIIDNFGNHPPELVTFTATARTSDINDYTIAATDWDQEALTYSWRLEGDAADCGTTASAGDLFSWDHTGCCPIMMSNTNVIVEVSDGTWIVSYTHPATQMGEFTDF